MNEGGHSVYGSQRAALIAQAGEQLRPELHRYCSRLTGSVIDGEEVVQDALVRALAALDGLSELPPLRPWLFRIAHNRALDLLRSRALRATSPIDNAHELSDDSLSDPLELLTREEALQAAVSRFTELPLLQRSVIILKDVLDEPLAEIAELLQLSVDSVKAHLARSRARLRELRAQAGERPQPQPASAAVARYVAMFNQQDWPGLRALLADDVKLHQSTYPTRVGSADVGSFFGIYAKVERVWLRAAWLEGREVIAVFEDHATMKPSYFMRLEWSDQRLSVIRDYRYVRYVMADAELTWAQSSSDAVAGG